MMEKNIYASYPRGYKQLVKKLRIPLPYKLMTKMIMPLFVKILIDC